MELPEFQQSFGEKLRMARQAKGLSVSGLSRITKISKSHITGIEAGKINTCLDSILRLSKAVNVEFSLAWK
jgi:transcriptional regulator with XRE-family HTH domain